MAAHSSSGGGGKPPSRRDTPIDLVAVPRGETPEESSGLAALSSLETLEAAYELWADQRLRHAASRARVAEERRRLDEEAAFVVGAVKAAGLHPPSTPAAPDALATPGGLDSFVRDAEQRISETRARLDARAAAEEQAFATAFAQLQATIVGRIERILEAARPSLRMVPRLLAGERRIVHLDRISDDEAILLLHVLTGKIPSRYGFLLDDSTDDVLQAPPPLYPDEGVAPDQTRAPASALLERVSGAHPVLPVKGFLPVLVPVPGGAPAFYRLLQRGPVMEVELAEGDGFRNVLSREEAERIAGHFLRLKLAGKVELELAAE